MPPMPEHVRALREQIGSALVLLPSVSVLTWGEDGRVLLVRHSMSGAWGIVGGGIDVDETPEDAARRETLEETGLEVEVTRLRTVLGGPQFRLTYPNGDQAAYVQVVFDAVVTGGVEQPDDDETTEVGWFGPDELPTLDLGPFARATLAALDWLS